MPDGTPAHFSNVMQNLHTTYLGRWIGGGEPIAWPLHFPDLNPLDFFFYSRLKLIMYETLVATVEDHMARIVFAPGDIACSPDERVRQSFVRGWRLYYDLHGPNFEEIR
ncbi:uncharacterized protein TNCV_1702831 [Trichonephila clavipes]|nr:uncharacterized protein TNCV_1702831 [Trichonephila clavipes]